MHEHGSLMISVSGVRGLLGRGMNPETAARFAAAFAEVTGARTAVIGRDTRSSGPALVQAAVSALRFKGIDVTDLGVVSTPTVEIMTVHRSADCGIVVTASHNDERWNALKFLDSRGEFPDAERVGRIRSLAEGGKVLFDPPESIGGFAEDGSGDEVHVERIMGLELIEPEKVASLRLKAAVDCVNGAGSRIIPLLLERMGVETVLINTDIDSPFPHDPEPKPAALGDLARTVEESGADIGFACDPDADRLVLVDGGGKVLSEELTLALAGDFVLGRQKGPVVVNLSTTRLIDDIASKHGVASFRSPVGEANVTALMKEKGAVIGGEGNGGVIYPAIHYGRDAMTGIALILQHLAETGESLSEIAGSLPSYSIVKEKFEFEGDWNGYMERLKERFRGTYNDSDGIRIDMGEGWVHVRRSNTEPVVRIIAEAGSEERASELVKEAAGSM